MTVMALHVDLVMMALLAAILTGTDVELSPVEEIVIWQTHDIVMQCKVDKRDYEQIVWKKNSELLAVGSVLFSRDPRVRLLGLGRLQIKKSKVEDSATYTCQPGAIAPDSSRYQFKVKVEEYNCPTLSTPRNGKVVYYPTSSDGRHKNGTVAVVTCNDGFELTGKKNRTCCDCYNGWEGDTATCLSQELLEFQKQLSEMEKKLEVKVMNSLAAAVNESLGLPAFQAALKDVTNAQKTLEQWVHANFEQTDFKFVNITRWRLEQEHRQEAMTHKTDQEIGKIKYKQAHSDKHANEQILALKLTLGALEKSVSVLNNQTPTTSIDPSFVHEVRQNITDVENRVTDKLEELNFQMSNLNGNLERTKYNLQNVFGNNSVALLWETMQKHAVATKSLVGGEVVTEYYWIVHQVEAKINKVQAKDNWMVSVQSSYFYTDIPGYRFRLVLYPNYEMSDHIGMFAGLVPGEFDNVVVWPFRQEFHLAIVSHDPRVSDHVGLVQFPSATCSPSNFDRPEKSEVPSACGFRHFFSLEQLKRQKNAYLTAGHLWVRIRIFS